MSNSEWTKQVLPNNNPSNAFLRKWNRILLSVAGASCLIALCGGCASVEEHDIEYATPQSIPMKASTKVMIVTSGDEALMNPIKNAVTQAFSNSKSVTISSSNPDYWIVLEGWNQFHADTNEEIPYNKVVSVVENSSDSGGHDEVVSSDRYSSSSAAVVLVSVYSVKNLSPVFFTQFNTYDADFTGNHAERQANDYINLFQKQIVEKIKGGFLNQKRDVKTLFPLHADPLMRNALAQGNVQSVLTRAKEIIPDKFDSFVKDVVKGKYEEEEQETKLCNYYMQALAMEVNELKPDNLKKLHAQHLTIMNLTTDDGLKEACPNALARLEAKLNMLQAFNSR